ncbi:flagellar FliJ family protein [Marinobacter sp. CA1]|uniref:flagellar FliJ family protein n=1 Tax=Marinobacter sp. CA1 TaxID=2817656 RepID=UPI001D086A81|nr:flagellar FliJ family protein [Marinobacter sp. CA1]MCG8517624.1 flagellar FliJ family protein [Pseudomonadales bacterium]UDL05537.1 flagellar FliJ family protein [Marinobacter sp. CA1]
MFNRFLDQQQKTLERLGNDKQQQQLRHQQEQQRYDSLKFYVDSMASGASGNALVHQNRLAMRHQLNQLLDQQADELLLAGKELEARQRALLAQFGKVKGLELLVRRRQQQDQQRQRRQEQGQVDDWLNGAGRKG